MEMESTTSPSPSSSVATAPAAAAAMMTPHDVITINLTHINHDHDGDNSSLNNEIDIPVIVDNSVFSMNFPGFDHLQDSRDEWMMTLEGFIKFQLRRQAHPTAGVAPLKKNLMKILQQKNLPKEDEIFISLHGSSFEYLRHMMWTTEEYVTIHEDIRHQVIENAQIVMNEIKVTYMTGC